MTALERVIAEYLSKGLYTTDVPEELLAQLSSEDWPKLTDYFIQRTAAYGSAQSSDQKSGGNRVKAKQTLNQQWKAYLEKANNTTAQIDATKSNTQLSVLGINTKVAELRQELRAVTLVEGQKMRHLALYAYQALNDLFNSRSAQAPADMAPEQYQRQLLDTLALVERTKDFISKPEYDSAVAMFRNDPLAVKAFNKIFSSVQATPLDGEETPVSKFSLPEPTNRADEFWQLANSIEKLLLLSDGKYILDGSFNDNASLIYLAITTQIESIPEVEMAYTPPDPATLTRYQEIADAVAQVEQIVALNIASLALMIKAAPGGLDPQYLVAMREQLRAK